MKKGIIIALFAVLAFRAGAQDGGLGAVLKIDTISHYPFILTVLPSSAAADIQLEVFDFIHAVNGVDVKGKKLPEIVGLLRGPAGTRVGIKFTHGGEEYVDTFTRKPAETNKLYMSTPTIGRLYVPSTGDDENIDHFKDSLLKVLYDAKDSFLHLIDIDADPNSLEIDNAYKSIAHISGSFNSKIALNRHYYVTHFALSNDSVKTYLKYMFTVHQIRQSLLHGPESEVTYTYTKGKDNSRVLYYTFIIRGSSSHPELVNKGMVLIFQPKKDEEGKDIFDIALYVYA